ncbi:hypothetical protein L596_010107 [Steinernema carpocapsae]|uniref:Uncharacterized protein n=1 Tax=Steinernema carpocapsae TaxID=34508 RepID=A0A4U5PHW1_STECR|nr:hypothetical protein L596_010107 [Steinernema carpocapsae]
MKWTHFQLTHRERPLAFDRNETILSGQRIVWPGRRCFFASPCNRVCLGWRNGALSSVPPCSNGSCLELQVASYPRFRHEGRIVAPAAERVGCGSYRVVDATMMHAKEH